MVSDDEKKTIDEGRSRELSPGKLLVWGRERVGLTQEQVAKELYMTLTKVCALELDDYRHMGSDTFSRGYLRAYANLVKLDVVQVLAAYDRHALKHGLVEQVLPKKAESTAKPLWRFAVLIVLVLLVLWLISVWFFDNRKTPVYDRPVAIAPVVEMVSYSSVASSVVAGSAVASSVPFGIANPASGTNDAPVGAVSSWSVASSSVNPTVQSSSDVALSSSPALNLTVALDEIVFVFAEECWLEVSDSRGDVLIADLQPAGGRLVLQGKAPFDVKLGNAPAAQIELNNERITVVPALGTNVLSMKVGKPINE